ncbi:hypothetical protein HUJ05_006578 [Dendroctonus ponderosae]|nr:hypothetical protein HUJ05_006578 [Dendroctonus ponderosae]
MYSEGILPDDWLESLFITLPKKSNISTTRKDSPECVRLGGETINNIRYADDTAIMAETLEYILH